jgi:hypothetical protein
MIEITKETKITMAIQLVVMDAMEKGHTDTEEIIEYMKTDVFHKAVKNYVAIMDELKPFDVN